MLSKGDAHDAITRNRAFHPTVRSDANNPPLASQGSRHVKATIAVKRHSLRPPQSPIVRSHFAAGRNAEHVIEAGNGRPCKIKVLIGPKSQMICGDAGLDGRKDENLAVTINLENRPGSIAHV